MTHGSDLRDSHFKETILGNLETVFSKWTLQWMNDKNYIPNDVNQLFPQRFYCHLSDQNQNQNKTKPTQNNFPSSCTLVPVFPSLWEHMWLNLWWSSTFLATTKVWKQEQKNYKRRINLENWHFLISILN